MGEVCRSLSGNVSSNACHCRDWRVSMGGAVGLFAGDCLCSLSDGGGKGPVRDRVGKILGEPGVHEGVEGVAATVAGGAQTAAKYGGSGRSEPWRGGRVGGRGSRATGGRARRNGFRSRCGRRRWACRVRGRGVSWRGQQALVFYRVPSTRAISSGVRA
jgi:hypothetical protein